MAEPHPDSDARERAGGPAGAPPTPRWVKVFGAVAVALLVVVVILLVAGGHGPGRHGGAGDASHPATVLRA